MALRNSSLIATGRYIGEGFDLQRLDTLFLALPKAWKGTFSHYAGRTQCDAKATQEATVCGEPDSSLPVVERTSLKCKEC